MTTASPILCMFRVPGLRLPAGLPVRYASGMQQILKVAID